MALDDLSDSAKEEEEEEQVEGIMEELGVENKEELEELDGRVGTLSKTVVAQDKKINELEEEVKSLRAIVKNRLLEDGSEKQKESKWQ